MSIYRTFMLTLYMTATLKQKHLKLDKMRLLKVREKTDQKLDVALSKLAIRFTGMPGKPDELVFPDYMTMDGKKIEAATKDIRLQIWIKSAGIDSKITMRNARHTFAVTMLIATKNLFTVSKMLGHKNFTTTAKQAHIVDELSETAIKEFDEYFKKSKPNGQGT